jgi:hypothetical protein
MSESCTHNAPPKNGLKAGKLFRKEEPGQVHAQRNNQQPFFTATLSRTMDAEAAMPDMQAWFIPGIHRSVEEEDVQMKCADCAHEDDLQRQESADTIPVVHRSAKEEEVQMKCADCAHEDDLQRKESADHVPVVQLSEEEGEVQPKCATCDIAEGITPVLQRSEQPVTDTVPVQTSLKVGKPDDPYEVEADRMAERVQRMPLLSFTGGGGARPDGNSNSNNNIHRNEEEGGEVLTKPVTHLQKAGDGSLRTSDNFSARLKTGAPGSPLAAPVRQQMESAFQADFSAVRVHTGTESASLNREIGAQAFAYQHHIYFGENKYQPESSEGRFLLAHELTHTVQQGAAKTVQRDTADEKVGHEIQRNIVDGGISHEVQRDEEEGSVSLLDSLRLGGEYVLKTVLPATLYQFYQQVKSQGLLGYIKESLFSLFRGLFTGLGFSDGEFMMIIQIFLHLKAQLPAIIDGLAKGDCAPLFAALNVLSMVVSSIAGAVWDRLMNAIEPLRLWLIRIWDTYMAPALDRITAFAGELWDKIKRLGKWIWDAFYEVVIRPYRDAWDWICESLGMNDSSEGGFMSVVTDKLSAGWQAIKNELRPVIEPIQDVISGIGALIDMDAIRKLQDDATKWLDEVASTATAMGNDDDAVANKQLTLRDVLLPALNRSIDRLKVTIQAAGKWVVEKVNNIAGRVTGFFDGIRSNEYLSPVYSSISWLSATVDSVKDWAVDKVVWLFDKINTGMEYVRGFMQRVIDMLLKLVTAAGNLLGYLGDFILGPFNLVPKCIKDPIMKWLTEVILKKIPVISEFIDLAEKWPQIKAAALTVIQQVFVDGQLARGLWTYFRNLLQLIGIDPTLVTSIIAKAATNFSRIIKQPGEFLKNVWNVIKGGFVRFYDNIGTHLLTGAMDWLFGEVKGAVSVPPPRDFTIGSLLGYVMDLFGITKENVYTRMEKNPRIGPEKVKRIRQMEAVLTGALEWITVWIKEGPAGLLRKAKEKLDNLKEMVINGIISWVTTKISGEIMMRLATSADPLGIGATINTIILVYDTMKTAIEYANRILNIANQAMDNLAEIIGGQLEHAQVAFEELLGKAVPVVIGFSVEVIIGPVGDKIKDIVSAGRTKVDEAIDWLIDGALNLIDSIINAAKSAANAVLGWLGLRKEFTADDGETHSLSFAGTEERAELIVASRPMSFDKWIDAVTINDPDTPKGKGLLKKKEAARKKYEQIQRTEKKPLDAKYTEKKKYKELKQLLNELSALIAPFFKDDLPECSTDAPKKGVTFGKTKEKSNYGSSMRAEALTSNNMPDGSEPSISDPSAPFREINRRRNGGGSFYVLGHLLNHNLGGTGKDMKNLTPLTGSANGIHHSLVESNIKAAVKKKSVVGYTVTPIYDRGSTTSLENAVKNSKVPDRPEIIKIIKAEKHVPGALDCKAFKVNPKDKSRTPFFDRIIPNVIDQSPKAYDLVGIKRADVFLDCDDISMLRTIPVLNDKNEEVPMSIALANRIIKAMNDRKGTHVRFSSHGALANYEIGGKPVFNSEQQDQLNYISGLSYVKLYKV